MKKIIHLIAGARPNFIKVAPIYKKMKESQSLLPIIVHTGQHEDYNMSEAFYSVMGVSRPHICLNANGKSHAAQTANIMIAYEQKLSTNPRPDLVVVFGDVNSTLACALTAKKLGLKIAHVEAGLRSFDMEMPEEINRMLVDAISDYLFVTEKSGIENLKAEGVKGKSFLVGNVMIDTLYDTMRSIVNSFEEREDPYAVVTLHRPSNVDNKEKLEGIIEALKKIAEDMPVIFPVHPRTQLRLEELNLTSNGIRFENPKPYREFLELWSNAFMVLTDSGGLQEETTALGVPCFTIRDNTERPATVESGTNRLVGTDQYSILRAYNEFKNQKSISFNIPYLWDGQTSDRIIKIIGELI